MGDGPPVVVVGAGLAGAEGAGARAGARGAERLRAGGFAGKLALSGEEGGRPYEGPPLSKDHLHGKEGARDKAFVHEPGWYPEHAVDLRPAPRVTRLDPAAHSVT